MEQSLEVQELPLPDLDALRAFVVHGDRQRSRVLLDDLWHNPFVYQVFGRVKRAAELAHVKRWSCFQGSILAYDLDLQDSLEEGMRAFLNDAQFRDFALGLDVLREEVQEALSSAGLAPERVAHILNLLSEARDLAVTLPPFLPSGWPPRLSVDDLPVSEEVLKAVRDARKVFDELSKKKSGNISSKSSPVAREDLENLVETIIRYRAFDLSDPLRDERVRNECLEFMSAILEGLPSEVTTNRLMRRRRAVDAALFDMQGRYPDLQKELEDLRGDICKHLYLHFRPDMLNDVIGRLSALPLPVEAWSMSDFHTSVPWGRIFVQIWRDNLENTVATGTPFFYSYVVTELPPDWQAHFQPKATRGLF